MRINDYAIETECLTRCFGGRPVVDGLSLKVPYGGVTALIGRNGAGKTTTLKMLLGLLEPTSGSAEILGHDCRNLPSNARGRIGFMAEGHPVFGWMTVGDCEKFEKRFRSHWNSSLFDAVLKHFDIAKHLKAGRLSIGQRAGLTLGLTLAPEPDLLILDDPALGLDPVARRGLMEAMVYFTGERERTILFSSHLLSDVDRVADYIAVMDRGLLRALCPMDVMRESIRQYRVRFEGKPPYVSDLKGLLNAVEYPDHLRIVTVNGREYLEAELLRRGAKDVEEEPIGLEDGLIAYLGRRGEQSFFVNEMERGK